MSRISEHLPLALKVLATSLCLVVSFSGRYPPAQAQVQRSAFVRTASGISVEDVQQDDHIGEINKHIEATDGRVEKLGIEVAAANSDISALRSDLSGIHGEERGFAGFLAFLSGIQIFIQVRKKVT
jgi:hypothetical protein